MTYTAGGAGACESLPEHPADMSRAAASATLRTLLKYLAECIDILPYTELTYNALQRRRDGQVAAVPCRSILRQLQVSQPQNATYHIIARLFRKITSPKQSSKNEGVTSGRADRKSDV